MVVMYLGNINNSLNAKWYERLTSGASAYEKAALLCANGARKYKLQGIRHDSI